MIPQLLRLENIVIDKVNYAIGFGRYSFATFKLNK